MLYYQDNESFLVELLFIGQVIISYRPTDKSICSFKCSRRNVVGSENIVAY